MLPAHYTSAETSRVCLAYFAISALDLLKAPITAKQRADWRKCILQQFIAPSEHCNAHSGRVGFRGGPFLGCPRDHCGVWGSLDASHLTMTYTALNSLLILSLDCNNIEPNQLSTTDCQNTQENLATGEKTHTNNYPSQDHLFSSIQCNQVASTQCKDPFAAVDSNSIIVSLSKLQMSDGSFLSSANSTEKDIRFLFCACAVSYMLNDWKGVDISSAVSFIDSAQSYDGGFGQGPLQESHGGSTYCAIASLVLMGKLHELKRRQDVVRWLIARQKLGFHGRINKVDDTCYGFWIGGSLKVLILLM